MNYLIKSIFYTLCIFYFLIPQVQAGSKTNSADCASKYVLIKDGDTVWDKYTCKNCKTETPAIPASNGRQGCINCGSAHTDELFTQVEYRKGADGQISAPSDFLVTKSMQDRAKSKLWTCGFCTTTNFLADPKCLNCGAEHSVAVASVAKAASKTRTVASSAQVAPTFTTNASSGISAGKIGIGVGAAAVIGGGAWWAFSTKEVEGKVTNTNWEHTVRVERFTLHSGREWREKIYESQPIMPQNGVGERSGQFNIRNCRLEEDHSDMYQCGTKTERVQKSRQVEDGKDCNMVPNGNGSSTNHCTTKYKTETYYENESVPVYCPREKDRCDYDTYRWKEIDKKTFDGFSVKENPLPWPTVNLGKFDRAVKIEKYSVDIDYVDGKNNKSHSKKIDTEADLHTWKEKQKVKLDVYNMGLVKEVKR